MIRVLITAALLSTSLSHLASADNTDAPAQPCFIVPLLDDKDISQACLWQTQLQRREDIRSCLVANPPAASLRQAIVGQWLFSHYIMTGAQGYLGDMLTQGDDTEAAMAFCLLRRADERGQLLTQ